eukprot:7453393-Pyramimonas_sp.AAC.2
MESRERREKPRRGGGSGSRVGRGSDGVSNGSGRARGGWTEGRPALQREGGFSCVVVVGTARQAAGGSAAAAAREERMNVATARLVWWDGASSGRASSSSSSSSSSGGASGALGLVPAPHYSHRPTVTS